MAISVNLKTNHFGRPYPNGYGHHWIGLGVVPSGGSGNAVYEFRKAPLSTGSSYTYPSSGFTEAEALNINSTHSAWETFAQTSSHGWTDLTPDGWGNFDGFGANIYRWHTIFALQVRNKNNPSEYWVQTIFDLQYRNDRVGFHMGTTPTFTTSQLVAGATVLSVKGKVGDLIKLYRSNQNGSFGDNLLPNWKPIKTAVITNPNGNVDIVIPPAVNGEKYYATATHKDTATNRLWSWESLSSRSITVGGVKEFQPEFTVNYGATTSMGRKCTINMTNGSGRIGTSNDSTYAHQTGVEFDIPFGVDSVYLLENAEITNVGGVYRGSNSQKQISIQVDGGVAPSGNGATYGYNFRNDFSSSSATQNKIGFTAQYGKKVGSTFTLFDEFAVNDLRQAWAMASDSIGIPQLGIDDPQQNTSVIGLTSDKILMHPFPTGDVSIKFDITLAGTFSVNSNAMRAGRTDNPFSTPPQSNFSGRVKVIHNGIEKITTLLNTQGVIVNVNVADFAVAVGDTVEYVVTNNSGDGSFGHYHIGGGVSLVTTNGGGGGSNQAPSSPIVTNGTSQQVGSEVIGISDANYIVVLKDGYPESLAIKNGSNWSMASTTEGSYAFMGSSNKVLSGQSSLVSIGNQTNICASLVHRRELFTWHTSLNSKFVAIKFPNHNGYWIGQVVTENPFVFKLRGKEVLSGNNIAGTPLTFSSGISSSFMQCFDGSSGMNGLLEPDGFPTPQGYERVDLGSVWGWVYQPISGGQGSFIKARAMFDTASSCANGILQFGISTSATTQPTSYEDADQNVRLALQNGSLQEVQSGGNVFQQKTFANLTAGTYYVFCRNKDNPTEVTLMGSRTIQ